MSHSLSQAAKLRLAIQLGAREVPDAVRWAEKAIAASDAPSDSLIELALMDKASPIDVFGKLGEIAGDHDPLDFLAEVLAQSHDVLIAEPEFGPSLARNLYSLFVESDYNVPAEFSEISFFEDSYALAAQGTYGSRQDVYDQLLEFTGRFKDDA